MRLPAALSLALLLLAGWYFLPRQEGALPAAGAQLVARSPSGRSAELSAARAALDRARLDAFVAEQERRCEREPEVAEHWRVLAEACLERALLADLGLGLAVGRPSRDELPPEVAADVERGMRAVERALALGDESGEAYRVLCALLSRQIVGVASFLRLNGRLDDAVERASALDASNPRVLVARGCRKLFAPKLLGHDPEASLPLLLAAAEALPHDERPLIYAAFACWLLEDAEGARELLARAAARTPAHPWVPVVIERLEAGEADPFRDL